MQFSIETVQIICCHYKSYETVTAMYTQPCNTIYTSISAFNPLNGAFQAKNLLKRLDTFDVINILYECVCMYVYV